MQKVPLGLRKITLLRLSQPAFIIFLALYVLLSHGSVRADTPAPAMGITYEFDQSGRVNVSGTTAIDLKTGTEFDYIVNYRNGPAPYDSDLKIILPQGVTYVSSS